MDSPIAEASKKLDRLSRENKQLKEKIKQIEAENEGFERTSAIFDHLYCLERNKCIILKNKNKEIEKENEMLKKILLALVKVFKDLLRK